MATHPLQYSCLENLMAGGVCHSPWGRKELHMTERLHFLFFNAYKFKNNFDITEIVVHSSKIISDFFKYSCFGKAL